MRRAGTILLSTIASIVALLAFLLVPVSVVIGAWSHVAAEIIVAGLGVAYVARVMRADRRARLAAQATLPSARQPTRRAGRAPITFQVRETLALVALWFALVFAFDAIALGMGPAANVGISTFAAFMLATLTVTGRHMMFRLTREEDGPDDRGA